MDLAKHSTLETAIPRVRPSGRTLAAIASVLILATVTAAIAFAGPLTLKRDSDSMAQAWVSNPVFVELRHGERDLSASVSPSSVSNPVYIELRRAERYMANPVSSDFVSSVSN